MRPRIVALIVVVASIALPSTGYASNMGFLEFSPSAYFTDKDFELLKAAAQHLLDDHKDGESISWKNEQSGHNGKLTLLRTFTKYGTTCRGVKVFSDAIEVSTTRVVTLCKDKEGAWKILK